MMLRRLFLFGMATSIKTFADTPPTSTDGRANGRYRQAINESERATFVVAIHDTVDFLDASVSSQKLVTEKDRTQYQELVDRFFVKHFSYSDLARKITPFYEDPANLNIPIIEVYVVAINDFKGASPEETKAALARWRKLNNDLKQ